MSSCVWVWDSIGWGESPLNPHNCPPNSHCPLPGYNGTSYGQIAVVNSPCEPD